MRLRSNRIHWGMCVVAVVNLWCATVLGTMVLRGCVCVAIAVVGPTMVTRGCARVGGMPVRFGGIPWCMCVVAVIGLLRPEGWYSMATHPSDP